MKILIIYSTDNGTTKKCANLLREKLGNEVDVVNLADYTDIDMNEYDTIVIGASIHMGSIQKKMKRFLENNEESLLKQNLALFICCGRPENIDEYFEREFPHSLTNHAFAKINMGYSYDFDDLNFMKKMIIKKVAGIDDSQDRINYRNIDKLADMIRNNA